MHNNAEFLRCHPVRFAALVGLSALIAIATGANVSRAVHAATPPLIAYRAFVTGRGFQGSTGQPAATDGQVAGTVGQGLATRAFTFNLVRANGIPASMSLTCVAHVSNIGDLPPVGEGENCGRFRSFPPPVENPDWRVEAVTLRFTGPPNNFTLTIQCHVQNIGWMPPVHEGQMCGTTGRGLRLEAIIVSLEKSPFDSQQLTNALMYDRANQQGARTVINQDLPKLAGTLGTSLTTSWSVPAGKRITLYTLPNWKGACVTLEQVDPAKFGPVNAGNTAALGIFIISQQPPGSLAVNWRCGENPNFGIVFFAGRNFTGGSFFSAGGETDMSTRLNGAARLSVQLKGFNAAALYSEPNFAGTCDTILRSVPDTAALSVGGGIRSVALDAVCGTSGHPRLMTGSEPYVSDIKVVSGPAGSRPGCPDGYSRRTQSTTQGSVPTSTKDVFICLQWDNGSNATKPIEELYQIDDSGDGPADKNASNACSHFTDGTRFSDDLTVQGDLQAGVGIQVGGIVLHEAPHLCIHRTGSVGGSAYVVVPGQSSIPFAVPGNGVKLRDVQFIRFGVGGPPPCGAGKACIPDPKGLNAVVESFVFLELAQTYAQGCVDSHGASYSPMLRGLEQYARKVQDVATPGGAGVGMFNFGIGHDYIVACLSYSQPADLAPVGVALVEPLVSEAVIDQPLSLSVTWSVPGVSWHDLASIEVQLTDSESDLRVLRLRFDEATRTVSVFDEEQDQFGEGLALGESGTLANSLFSLNLGQSQLVTTGPDDPSVTLQLMLTPKVAAAGRSYSISVSARDDLGEEQGADLAGLLLVPAAQVPDLAAQP